MTLELNLPIDCVLLVLCLELESAVVDAHYVDIEEDSVFVITFFDGAIKMIKIQDALWNSEILCRIRLEVLELAFLEDGIALLPSDKQRRRLLV